MAVSISTDLLDTIEDCARNIRLLAGENRVTIPPRKTDRMAESAEPRPYEHPDDEPTQHEIIQRADELTEQVQQHLFPAFTFDRAEQASIPEDAFWELQTYLGLGADLCANEGARSFITESTREQTPLGHVHRSHIRQQLSIESIREMYYEAMQRLLAETTSRSEYFGEAAVAIDTTEAEPFTGDRDGHEDEIIGTKEDNDEYAYQWATIQTVGRGPRVMLDARPVRKGDTLVEIVADLLYSLWRLIDHLVQVCFTDTFTDEPWVTMHDVLTSMKKHTGIG